MLAVLPVGTMGYFMDVDGKVCPLGADPESPRPHSGDLHQYCRPSLCLRTCWKED